MYIFFTRTAVSQKIETERGALGTTYIYIRVMN